MARGFFACVLLAIFRACPELLVDCLADLLTDYSHGNKENDVTTMQTENFEIGFGDPEDNGLLLYGNQYGWFDHNEHGDEYGGFLFFKNGELVDYDGISGYLPKEVLDALEAIGFDVNEMRRTGE